MSDDRSTFGDIEHVWPNGTHTLRAEPANYYSFAHIGWQRHHGLHGRISGYRRAAELLFASVVTSGSISDLDTVVFPYVTCWRHHLELHLKDTLATFRELRNSAQPMTRTHNLAVLWSELQTMICDEWPDDTAGVKHVNRIVGQLTGMDPTGEGFRYDRDSKGKLTLGDVDRVDLPSFHESLIAVSNFLDGAHARADAELEAKREMESYYADEARDQY